MTPNILKFSARLEGAEGSTSMHRPERFESIADVDAFLARVARDNTSGGYRKVRLADVVFVTADGVRSKYCRGWIRIEMIHVSSLYFSP